MPYQADRKHLDDYKCDKCEHVARSDAWLNTQKMKNHGPIPSMSQDFNELTELNCKQCVFEAQNKDEINNHMENVHKQTTNISCNLCNFKTSTRDNMDQHVQSNHIASAESEHSQKFQQECSRDSLREITCIKCNFKCITMIKLDEHMEDTH